MSGGFSTLEIATAAWAFARIGEAVRIALSPLMAAQSGFTSSQTCRFLKSKRSCPIEASARDSEAAVGACCLLLRHPSSRSSTGGDWVCEASGVLATGLVPTVGFATLSDPNAPFPAGLKLI